MIKPRSGRHRGRLVGGCLEVIDWLRGAPIWPDHFVWRDSIVFLEISEDAPSASAGADASCIDAQHIRLLESATIR